MVNIYYSNMIHVVVISSMLQFHLIIWAILSVNLSVFSNVYTLYQGGFPCFLTHSPCLGSKVSS